MMSLDPELLQQQIDDMAAANKWPDAITSALKASAADAQQATAQQAKATLMNEIIHPWFADDSKTIADLQAAIAEFVQ